MIKLLFVICVTWAFNEQHFTYAQDVDGFSESWTAQQKVSAVWSKILEKNDTTTYWLWPVKPLSVFFHDFNLSFERTDFLQKTWWSLWLLPRWRGIHTVGVVQQVRWVPEAGQPYTGIFAGDQYGIVRYSLGLENSAWEVGDLLPGMALKFFRDGVHSGNMHTITGLGGQNSTNFFFKNFQNHIRESRSTNAQLGAALFSTGQSHFPFTVGTKDFASYNEQGQLASAIKFPFRVVYKPQVSTPERSPEWPGLSDETKPVAFHQDLIDSLSAKDQLLFNVYAYEYPQDLKDSSKLTLIGKLYSNSEAVRSSWADDNLHFPHMPIEEDLEAQPTWSAYVPKYTPNLFEINWDQDINTDYIAVSAGNPTNLLSNMFNRVKMAYRSLFYETPRCPYGFH